METMNTEPTTALTLDELNQKITDLEDKIYIQKYFLTGGEPDLLPERSKQLVADLETQLTDLENQKAALPQ